MLVALLTLLVRVVAMVKDMAVASSFGLGDALDAFLMAYLIPSFALTVIAGSIYAALVPVLVGLRETHGHAEARRLFSSISFIALIVLASVTLVLALGGEWLLGRFASGFSAGKLAMTAGLFELMLPLVLISGMSILGGAALNAQKKFALPAIAPILTPFVIILGLTQAANESDARQLVVWTLVGCALELSLVLWGLHKAGYLCLPRFRKLDEHSRRVIEQYLPMLSGAFLMGGTVVIDQIMAAWLDAGSVSALNYANKAPALVTGLAATALATAALPYLSRQVAQQDFVASRHTLTTYSMLIIKVFVPITVLGIFFAEPLVRLLFERGSFGQADTRMVSEILRYSLLQVPFYVLGTLYAKFVSVLRGNKYLFYGATISLLLNIVMNLALMRTMGVAGIALSTSIVYVVAAAFLGWISVKSLNKEIRLGQGRSEVLG